MKAKTAISKRYGTDYTVGNIAEAICKFGESIKSIEITNKNVSARSFFADLASGSSIDWVYGKLNVPLTYTFEFRDKGRHGFLLPAKQIIPNSLEVIDGLVAMIKESEKLNYM